MTSQSSGLAAGGAGSVLLIWSGLVVVIGIALLGYGVLVVGRERRRRNRDAHRHTEVGPRSSGFPTSGPAPLPYPGAVPPLDGRALPTRARQLALPAGPSPAYPQVGYPSTPMRALPAAPSHAYPPGPGQAYPAPGPVQAYPPTPGQTYPASPAAPPLSPPPVLARREHVVVPAGSAGMPGPATAAATPLAVPQPPPPAPGVPNQHYGRPDFALSYSPPVVSAPPPGPAREAVVPETRRQVPGGGKRGRRGQQAKCAALRAEAEELTQQAENVTASAGQAALAANQAYAHYLAAREATGAALRAHQEAARAAASTSVAIERLERPDGPQAGPGLERETSHAAFAAYRRGDISAEQLREVFRRAEGWTPEHDRLSHEAMRRRAEESEAARALEMARAAEASAAERSRLITAQARTLGEEARQIQALARDAWAAVEECEHGRRRR